jgi:hypothetical protein
MRAEQAAAAEHERGLHLGCLLADKLSRPRSAERVCRVAVRAGDVEARGEEES